MAVIILGCREASLLRYWVQNRDKEKLKSVCHKDLLGILEHKGVIRYSPTGRVVLERLGDVRTAQPVIYTVGSNGLT